MALWKIRNNVTSKLRSGTFQRRSQANAAKRILNRRQPLRKGQKAPTGHKTRFSIVKVR